MAANRLIGTVRRRRPGPVIETILVIAAALFFALAIQAYAVKPYRIPSGSMEPTLHVGDRVLVNRFSQRFLSGGLHVGEIVVFTPPRGADAQPAVCGAAGEGDGTRTPCDAPTSAHSSQTFIKRIVGLGGDRIQISAGHVIRNGVPQREAFAAPCGADSECEFPDAVTVPKGDVYLLGDNRGNSDDSRFWGPIPRAWVVGEAVARYWPPDRVGSP
ncbi:MAG TPA: signal peptidase I [Solirubrobacteraceae bacterium]|nr:signal peptidase I [Solirubrobacteraceae bacterium]